jgi:hypothetical protein
MAWAMKKDQVVIIQVIHNPSSLSKLQSLKKTTLQKQRKKISHQKGMKEKVPESNLKFKEITQTHFMIKEIISMEEIDCNLFQGTKVFSMVIVFSVLTLVTKL